MRRVSAIVVALFFLLAASEARANGRYPQSNQVYFSETNPNVVIVRVTFGLLVSTDRGQNFDWVCEGSIGFFGNEDPMYAITSTGRIVTSTYEGVKLSPNLGCDFAPAAGEASNHVFVDLAARPGATSQIAILESVVDHLDDAGIPQYQTQLWETKDEGKTIARLGPALDPKLLASTIDVVRTDPNRIYATGKTATRDGVFLASRDHGQTWETTAIPLGAQDVGVFIAGVDPTDGNRVYLRTSGNANNVPARLLLVEIGSSAATTKVTNVYTGLGVLPGFALTPDGKKIYVGGPLDGVRVASTSNFAFEARSNLETYCLGVSADGVWGCSTGLSGIVLGLSTDDGKTFTKRIDFCDVRGPLACGARGTYDKCSSLWPLQRSLFACPATQIPGSNGDASTTATSGGAPGTGTGPGGSANGGPNGNAPGAGGSSFVASGSGCSLGSSRSAFGAAGALLAAIVAFVRRRQRKRASA